MLYEVITEVAAAHAGELPGAYRSGDMADDDLYVNLQGVEHQVQKHLFELLTMPA